MRCILDIGESKVMMHRVKGAYIHMMPAKATTVKKNADNKKDDKITTDKKRTQERTRLVTNISGGYPRVRRPWAPRARGG